jgi:soluble lytic murein transglycosylase-like protein
LASLEGSGDDAVSPKGAIGKYQIMPATARQYMGKDFDVKTLFDPGQ